MMDNIRVMPDGFVWLVVGKQTATTLIDTGKVCVLHDDGTETEVDDVAQMLRSEEPIGLGIGFMSELMDKYINAKRK